MNENLNLIAEVNGNFYYDGYDERERNNLMKLQVENISGKFVIVPNIESIPGKKTIDETLAELKLSMIVENRIQIKDAPTGCMYYLSLTSDDKFKLIAKINGKALFTRERKRPVENSNNPRIENKLIMTIGYTPTIVFDYGLTYDDYIYGE